MEFLIAVDQLINTLIYIKGDGWGYADETMSARCWRCYLQGHTSDLPYRTVDAIMFLQKDHCYQSWLSELDREQLPSYYTDISK
jgi:hypothetical protein